jgi:hypothetical protein
LYRCGAHFVADTIAELPHVLRRVEEDLRRGLRP